MQQQQRYIPTLHLLDHSAAFRCLWALEELRQLRAITYHVKTYKRQRGAAPAALKEIFPLGKSPILMLECAAADEPPPTIQIQPGVLTEALLILRFLNDEYSGGELWGNAGDDADRRRDEFLQEVAVATLLPKMDVLVILESILAVFPFGIRTLVRWAMSPLLSFCRAQLQPIFHLLEDLLGEGKGKRPWFAGARFGVADFNLSWGIDMATQRGYLDPTAFPKLVDWHERIKARSGYRSALEKCNGYDLKTFGI